MLRCEEAAADSGLICGLAGGFLHIGFERKRLMWQHQNFQYRTYLPRDRRNVSIRSPAANNELARPRYATSTEPVESLSTPVK